MSDRLSGEQLKLCCASFYESDLARLLLGDVLHPGGLELTERLGSALELTSRDRVLDIACGRGSSAVHIAERLGCHVTGLDYGVENIAAARRLAQEHGVSGLAAFCQGDAEMMPITADSFDALISECSYCTFANRPGHASEAARVLKPGGRLGVTDITVNGPLPEEIQTALAWVACIRGAGTTSEYVSEFADAGFDGFAITDQSVALHEMISAVRRKLFALNLAMRLSAGQEKSVALGDVGFQQAKGMARQAVGMIEKGTIGYTMITALLGS